MLGKEREDGHHVALDKKDTAWFRQGRESVGKLLAEVLDHGRIAVDRDHSGRRESIGDLLAQIARAATAIEHDGIVLERRQWSAAADEVADQCLVSRRLAKNAVIGGRVLGPVKSHSYRSTSGLAATN
jgi:hypothetical protein